jgi:hypothetical protein
LLPVGKNQSGKPVMTFRRRQEYHYNYAYTDLQSQGQTFDKVVEQDKGRLMDKCMIAGFALVWTGQCGKQHIYHIILLQSVAGATRFRRRVVVINSRLGSDLRCRGRDPQKWIEQVIKEDSPPFRLRGNKMACVSGVRNESHRKSGGSTDRLRAFPLSYSVRYQEDPWTVLRRR